MIHMFDYGSITEEHKSAAEECAKLIEGFNPNIANEIRTRFKIVEPPKMNPEDSEFFRIVKQFGLDPMQQGYMVGPDGVHIPMMAVMADLNKFDELLNHLKTKFKT